MWWGETKPLSLERSGAVINPPLDLLLSCTQQEASGGWDQMSALGSSSSDRKLYSEFFLLCVTQLSYIAEDENGKIVGYVLAKM